MRRSRSAWATSPEMEEARTPRVASAVATSSAVERVRTNTRAASSRHTDSTRASASTLNRKGTTA